MKTQIDNYIVKSVKTSIYGLFLTLLIGLFVREFTRGLKQSISLFDFNVVDGFLELAHGHGLMFFCIIPLILALIFFVLKDKFDEGASFRKVSIYTGIMHMGFFLTLLLMMYKGMAYVQQYQSLQDLTKIDSSLFGGNHVLRILLYSVSHIAMATGLFGIGIFILRNVKTK
jgi:heme/copper-type cytochrome/quinol oxidase subunit 1